jgi:hypothetical protein
MFRSEMLRISIRYAAGVKVLFFFNFFHFLRQLPPALDDIGQVMEHLLQDILESPGLLIDQIRGHVFRAVSPDGPTLIIADRQRRWKTSHPGRAGLWAGPNAQLIEQVCDRLDDGEDPLMIEVKGGCLAACQLATSRVHCGYLLVYLQGYAAETAQANLPLFELIFAQAAAACELIEKNNQMHHLKLLHLSRGG